MSPEPFPDDGPGAPEPGGPAGPGEQPAPGNAPRDLAPQDGGRPEDDWDAEDWDAFGAAQEAAGEWQVPPQWRTGDLTARDLSEAGFGGDGQADQMPPGPVLATLVDAAADAKALAALSDDELIGVIAAARRTEARAVWAGMAATAEFAARRQEAPTSRGCFGADELAGRLNLTWQSAAGQMTYAELVARRLPRTFAALGAGLIHPVHVRIIEDETSILSGADAAAADEKLAAAAQSMTFGRLRYAAHRLVLTLDAGTAGDLVAAAARHPRTRWCLTVVHPDGTAAAHGCAPGRHPGPPPLSAFRLNAVIRGPCDHAQAGHRYRPGRALRHLIAARNARCTAPGCNQPAAACDLDHTTPWHHGGPTCPCNLAPLCRHHHRCKQAQGWWLDQPTPGTLIWRTPTGRSYTTTPTVYPV